MDTDTPKSARFSMRTKSIAGALALVAIGGTAGALTISATRPSVELAPLRPVAINSLTDSDAVISLKGQVAEVYGNKFVLADASGRALVDTGRGGWGSSLLGTTPLVATGQTVSVQGRFDHGFVRASFLVDANGKVISLRPMGRRHGRHGDHGFDGRRGPGSDDQSATSKPTVTPAPTPSK